MEVVSGDVDEVFFWEGEGFIGMGIDAPLAGGCGGGNGVGDESSGSDFVFSDPFGDDADAHAEHGHLFDGLHITEREWLVVLDDMFVKVAGDDAFGFALCRVADESDIRELFMLDLNLLAPSVIGGRDEAECVLRERCEDVSIIVRESLDAEAEIDLAGFDQFKNF